MRDLVDAIVASPVVRGWVAERDGVIVGTADVEWPDRAGWISGTVEADPNRVAYLGTMAIVPEMRGGGVGTAFASHLLREFDTAGMEVSLLHYAALSPLSAPFWHRMGYRPLWTTWQAQPHPMLR